MTAAMARIRASVRRETEQRLRRLAHAATVLIDGEAFRRIPLRPELNTGDDYAVDHASFLAVKQMLMKLKRLEDGDVAITSWRKWKDTEMEQVCPVDLHHLQVRPGNHPISQAHAAAFNGETACYAFELRGEPALAVCAPIRDSMDDVAGVVEIFASLAPERMRAGLLEV
jgi:hypothetical protein